VSYYQDNMKGSIRGHFDLRNVVKISPCNDADAPDAVDIDVAEGDSKGRPAKKLIISFVADKDDRANWLQFWCSAILEQYVHEKLKSFIDLKLAAQYNSLYADQPACAAKLSRFSKYPSTTTILSPRSASQQVPDQLDTPRAPETVPISDVPSEPPQPPVKKMGTSLVPAPAPASDDADVTFEVTVPDGVKPGDKLQATTPSGVKVKLVVPDKAEPGMSLTFTLPKSQSPKEDRAAIAIQARVRGRKGRKDIPTKKEEDLAGMTSGTGSTDAIADQQKAAVALQSSFRGHTVRNEQQEQSRLQWMDYYKQPHVADFDKALDLAVTVEEEEAIFAAQKLWASEEARRIKWFKHYLESNNLKEAAKLVVTPLEEAKLITAQVHASLGPCSCMGETKQLLDARRTEKFKDAIKAYDWVIAETLASSDEEMQDLDDSKLRVEVMMAAKVQGHYDLALAYAITEAEREEIEANKGAVEASIGVITGEQEAAAAKMQARIRGSSVRNEREKQRMVHAAVLVQKSYRGHSERDNQEEQRRLTWLQWHLDQREFGQALDLAISKDERQRILEAKATSEQIKWCNCFSHRPQGRKEKFVAAIRNYDWDQAQLLAVGDDERQDLEDSRNRVAWMLHYTADGKYEEALALAITDEERAEVENK